MKTLNVGDWVEAGGKRYWICECKSIGPLNITEEETCAYCGTSRPPEGENGESLKPAKPTEEAGQEVPGSGVPQPKGMPAWKQAYESIKKRHRALVERVEALEAVSHVPFDFSVMESRLSRLDAAHSETPANGIVAEDVLDEEIPGATTVPEIEVGEGYRRLGEDELIMENDQFCHVDCSDWPNVHPGRVGRPVSAESYGGEFLFRRRIETPSPLVYEGVVNKHGMVCFPNKTKQFEKGTKVLITPLQEGQK